MAFTLHRNYKLPNKYHDVVEDITAMRKTFTQIDSDIAELEAITENSSTEADTAINQIVRATISERVVKDISPRRFLAIDPDGVCCVDSSENGGGTTGQCTVKLSADNFDQGWADILEVSKNGQTVKMNATEATGSDTVILCDLDNNFEAIKPEFVYLQAVDATDIQNNESVILVDEIENASEIEQIASQNNNGIIQIGDGVDCDNGVISVAGFSVATSESHGLVKIGSGFDISAGGVLSAQEVSRATDESFGVVKLGSEFETNDEGALTLVEQLGASGIYGLGTPKIVENGNIYLEESSAWYRAFVKTDLQFSINIGFIPTNDFTFVLEIISDGLHLINFDADVWPVSKTMPVNRGTTKIYFTKRLGVPHFEVTVSQLDAPDPVCLTPATAGRINSNFLMYAPQGGNWNPYNLLKDSYDGYSDIKEVIFEFETLVCVEYVRYLSRASTTAMGEFILSGSNDKTNWTALLHKNGEIVYGNIYTEIKGCFRYYKVSIGYTSDDNKPGVVMLYGTQIDNNESELVALTPLMSSNATSYATLTGSNIKSNSAVQLTDNDLNSFITLGYDDESNRWLKYELTTAAAANLLELNFRGGDYQTNWFVLEGSNDDTEWTLLLERQYQGNFLFNNGYRIVYIPFKNDVEYKYYRLRCVATNSTNESWEIAGFKLYKRSVGKHNFYTILPKMQSAEQDGYVVTASGRWSSSYAEWMAFDGNSSTAWSGSGSMPAWLQIQLPAATVVNTAYITARSSDVAEMPKDFTIEGSNDGENFTVLDSQTDISWSASETKIFNFENETAYTYYRLAVSASSSTNVSLSELDFGTTRYDYKRYLEKYDYLVPELTSNTSEDGYIASASSQYSNNEGAWRAFDRQTSQWTTINGVNSNVELKIQLPTAVACNLIKLETSNALGRIPCTFRIEASNDDINWTVLHQELENANLSVNTSYYYENPYKQTAFKYYRLYILTNNGDGFISLREFQLIDHYLISEY